jgi:pimeloyl-ACP methyl ester carboxylesterase
MQLFYRTLGEGKPVIILHGVFGSSDNWITPAKLLADKFQLFLLDQRNHGQSPHSDEFDYKVLSEDIKEFIQEHKISNPHIIGHSMGGKAAMRFASENPGLFEKLIVVDIAPKYYPLHHQKILEGLNAIDLKNLESRQQADEILSKYVEEFAVRQFLLKNLYRKDNNEFVWRINLPVLSEKISNVGEAMEENRKVQTKTLFIKGEKSNYIKSGDEELIRKIFPHSEIDIIGDAGHWVQAEKPEEFAFSVKKFLLNN